MISSNPLGPWLLVPFFILLGSTAALWLEYFFRRRFPRKFKKTLTEVVGREFRHREVVIDGKKFIDCTFDGVTLVSQGTGLYGFESNRFSGVFSIRVDSQPAEGGLGLAKLRRLYI
jgi:hypothetical protein